MTMSDDELLRLARLDSDAGDWSNPGTPDNGHVAELPPAGFDYSGGMFGTPHDANAYPAALHPAQTLRTDLQPRTFQMPHEATHRRYEPPAVVPINQTAAGFTLISAPTLGLHFVKLLGCFITLDAAGTLRWVQGSADGTNVGNMTGNIGMGGAAATPHVLAVADVANPWLFTSSDQALGIFTVTGKAQGWAIVCFSPYDS